MYIVRPLAPQVVLAAVERHGGALQFCAKDLQRDGLVLRTAGRSLVTLAMLGVALSN